MLPHELPKRKKVIVESPIEGILLRELNLLELYPETQFKVSPYRIDIAFPISMLAIECDGRDFHNTPEQKQHDDVRDKYLRSLGWEVIRFSGSDIYRFAQLIAQKLAGVRTRYESTNRQEAADKHRPFFRNVLKDYTDEELTQSAVDYEIAKNQKSIESVGNVLKKRYRNGFPNFDYKIKNVL